MKPIPAIGRQASAADDSDRFLAQNAPRRSLLKVAQVEALLHAARLLDKRAITQQEFDALKPNALSYSTPAGRSLCLELSGEVLESGPGFRLLLAVEIDAEFGEIGAGLGCDLEGLVGTAFSRQLEDARAVRV